MAPTPNGRVIFNKVPDEYPIPGKTTVYDLSQQIDLENIALNGGMLVKTLYLSIDPYMRGRMRLPGRTESYTSHFELGEPLQNFGICIVLRSEDPDVSPGEYLYGVFPFQQYTVMPPLAQYFEIVPAIKLEPKGVPLTAFLGAGGLPGQTAFFAWKEFIEYKANKGDVIYVSAGAGAVGSIVVQLAKRHGLRVIASAGSEAKIKFLNEIGADVAFNYKKQCITDVLQKEGPINFYWDNVGGEALDAALACAKRNAIFVIAGAISEYNGQSVPLKNFALVFEKAIILNGCILTDPNMIQHAPEFTATVPGMIASGELKYMEDITMGLENAGEAILALQQGRNGGKSIVCVAES